MRSGQTPGSQLVNAAADLVAGAVGNLEPGRIRVTIDGVSYPVRARDDSAAPQSTEWLEQAQKAERYYSDKLAKQFAFIEGVMISVTVKPNFKRTEEIEDKPDAKNVVAKPVTEETTNDETRSSDRGGGEAGVASNAGMSVPETAGAGQSSTGTNEKTRTEYIVAMGHSQVKTINPGGELTVTGASLLIPRTHFAQIYKKRTNMSDREPSAIELDPFIAKELERMRPAVKTCLALTTEDAVHVDAYTDLMPIATAAPQAASTSVTGLMGDHVKEIALGALALMSLLLVSYMVRRGAPVPLIAPQASAPAAPRTLSAAEGIIGEAGEGGAMLDGMELDDESVKAQQMLGQVAQMVDENPETAATLVKRWLSRA